MPKVSEFPSVTGFSNTLEIPVNDSTISKKISGSQLKAAWGPDYLGSAILSAGAHESSVVTIEPRDFLWVFVRIASYGGTPDPTGDIGSLRFNGDSGSNYWTMHLFYAGGAWHEVPTTNASLIRLAETNSRLSRNVFVTINNLANRGKTCNIKNQTGTADASVVGEINTGGGEWVNLTDQITSIQLVNAGSNNLGANSGFIVFGKNF